MVMVTVNLASETQEFVSKEKNAWGSWQETWPPNASLKSGDVAVTTAFSVELRFGRRRDIDW